MENIKEFLAGRNKAVSGSFDDFMKYSNEQGVSFSRPEVAEIAYHKCRTAIRTLSTEMRQASHEWLVTRGYESCIG